ncbi:MAG TPA: NADH-quinone oxidoreductase subunit M [Gemmataceae bacterium]|jgi:NADH-quinone oxidoreductase subunit M
MPQLLLLLLALPLATAIAVALLGPGRAVAVRWVSLASVLASLLLATIMSIQFAIERAWETPSVDATKAPLTFHSDWIKYQTRENMLPLHTAANGTVDSAIQFYVGIDGLNVWLILLTALLMLTSVLVSWTAITERVNEFHAWLFVLQLGMTGVFASFDVILFYVFFELTLVPLFFVIGIWGGPQRQYAARKFFIYTLAGSLITLLGVIGVALILPQVEQDRDPSQSPRLTFAIPELIGRVDALNRELPRDVRQFQRDPADMESNLKQARDRLEYWRRVQLWVFVAMMCGFAIKVPMFPLHTWLPLAHVEAPTAGSVLLAGILLKLGTYGFLRLSVPLAPDAALRFGVPVLGSLAVVGIIYGAFCSLGQDDIKKLVAYSSVSHLGLCMLGLFALNEVGLTGGLLQMVNHGLSTGALFLLVGMLYERYHTRKMDDYGGMATRLHRLAVLMVFITLSSIGLPGLNGFLGELLTLGGMYDFSGSQVQGTLLASLGATGVVLGAWYMLTMVRQVFFGPLKEPRHEGHGLIGDLNGRELAALLPVAGLCLALGVFPKPFFNSVRPEIQVVAGIAEAARKRADSEQIIAHTEDIQQAAAAPEKK